jgi:hypothetical protein
LENKEQIRMNQNQANDSSTTNLSRASMSTRLSAVSNTQRHSLPSQQRMTITMLLQQQSKNRNHPGAGDDEESEARRIRLCSFLQEALNLVDVSVSDLYENTIENEWE